MVPSFSIAKTNPAKYVQSKIQVKKRWKTNRRKLLPKDSFSLNPSFGALYKIPGKPDAEYFKGVFSTAPHQK